MILSMFEQYTHWLTYLDQLLSHYNATNDILLLQ